MTLRLTIGIDPGLTGAIAALADGEPVAVVDMPTMRRNGANEVCAHTLAGLIRELRSGHAGAYVSAALECVHSMPTDGRGSAFRFGEGFGKVKATLEVLGIPTRLVGPAVWKRHYALLKQHKDASRIKAITCFPGRGDDLRRKKDHGRADALLLAAYLNTLEGFQ